MMNKRSGFLGMTGAPAGASRRWLGRTPAAGSCSWSDAGGHGVCTACRLASAALGMCSLPGRRMGW